MGGGGGGGGASRSGEPFPNSDVGLAQPPRGAGGAGGGGGKEPAGGQVPNVLDPPEALPGVLVVWPGDWLRA